MPAAEKPLMLAYLTMVIAGLDTTGAAVIDKVTVDDELTTAPDGDVAVTVPTFVIEPAVTSAAVVV